MVAFRLALRYLLAKKSHNAVNIISLVAIIGVAIATAAIICVLSVFNGFSNLTSSRLAKTDPQLKVVTLSPSGIILNADSLALAIEDLPQVAYAAPTLQRRALAINSGAQVAVTLYGIPANYHLIVPVDSSIIDGQFLTSRMSQAKIATLSVSSAVALQSFPGSEQLLHIYAPRRIGKINPANPMAAFTTDSLYVAGVYRNDNSEADPNTIILPLPTLRSLMMMTSAEATAIEIALTPHTSSSQAVEAISNLLGPDYSILNQHQQQANSFRMIAIEKWITFLMLAFILIITSFNAISTLSMLIIEKRSNMFTLRALGAPRSLTQRIFFFQGLLISLLGGAIGILLGVVLCLVQQIFGIIKLNGAGTGNLVIDTYPVALQTTDIAAVALLILAIGTLVGLIAYRQSR